jgi:phage replication O-like protein O
MPDDKPSLSAGYCRVVNALAEGLAASSLTSLEHRVVWAVIRLTYGWQKGKDRIAASQLASVTGLTRQKCSSTLSGLIERGVIIREGGSQSAIKVNTKIDEWEQREKRTRPPENPQVNRKCKNGSVNPKTVHKDNLDTVHTKDRKDKSKNPSDSMSSGGGKQRSPKTKAEDHTPYEAIRELYHEILPELPECRVLSSTRKSQIKARWNQKVGRQKKPCNDLDFWRRFFGYVRKCPWLMGEIPPKEGRRQFIANLEWITNENNFAKIIEGEYEKKGGGE